jgi:hypothetical protein
MKRLIQICFVALLLPAMAQAGPPPHVKTPEQEFGFTLGADRKLADWTQLTAYYRLLAKESNRVRYEELGKTTEGRPFVAVTITSPGNMARLKEYQEIQARLADPRTTTPEQAAKLIETGRSVLVVTCNIHSDEIASSQSCAEFAYLMASGTSPEILNILDNTILVMVPSLNPDGEQLVVDWYKKYLGSPYEGTEPVTLWHHYLGHDDNRDWYIFSQVETQLTVTKVLNVWRPQVLYDIHQMQPNGPRLYLPPWVDPIDPNIDPLLVSAMNAVGTQTAYEVSETGKTGILIDGVYDMWSPARHYVAYHGGLRILTESASVNIASPIDIPFEKLDKGIGYDAKVAKWNFPNPWRGGLWRLSDIVDYQKDSFFSIANNVATHRVQFLTDFYHVQQDSVTQKFGGPYAYVIPSEQTDPGAAARLVNTLRMGQVEVERSRAPFVADGQTYTAGSYIVRLGQPYGPFAKTLLEIQHYPNIEQYPGGPLQRPYDVTAQTLPLLFGVKAVAVAQKFAADEAPVDKATASGVFQRSDANAGYVIGDQANAGYYAVFSLLQQGVRVLRLTGDQLPKGTFYIPMQAGLDEKLKDIAEKLPVTIEPAPEAVGDSALELKLPRIALYQSWSPAMDEGWTRWLFDRNGIPYTRVVDADLRKGNLNQRFDVLILPDELPARILHGPQQSADEPPTPPEYRGGLGEAGTESLRDFSARGGTVVAFNRASLLYSQDFLGGVKNRLAKVPSSEFYVPGSLLEVAVDPSNPIAFGSTPHVPIFFELSPAFEPGGNAITVAHYDRDDSLLSGWLLGGKMLNGAAALIEKPTGAGRLILFGFRPQYRGQSEVTYKLLYNSLLYAASAPVTLPEASHIAPGQ